MRVDTASSAAIRLVLGIPMGVLGILALWAALATGDDEGHMLIGVAITALGIWTLFTAWRIYRQLDIVGRDRCGFRWPFAAC
jgi:hypothetical protein